MAISTIFRDIRIGVETTSGSAVPAVLKVPALELVLATSGGEGEVFTPAGQQMPAFVTPGGDEMTEITVGGKPCYNALAYVFSPVLGYAAPAQQGTTAAYLWTFRPDSFNPETYKSYTIEEGPSSAGAQIPYGLVAGFALNFTRPQIELSGTGFAGKVTDNHTLSTVTTTIPVKVIKGDDVCVYLEDTYAALATATALTDVAEVEIHCSAKYQEWWSLNCGITTFADVIELQPDVGGRIMALYNANGIALRTAMRAGTTKWLRIIATGATIEGAYPYKLQITCPIQFTNPGDREDNEGAYALGFNFVAIHDALVDGSNPGAIHITLQNTVTDLDTG